MLDNFLEAFVAIVGIAGCLVIIYQGYMDYKVTNK